MRLQIQTKTGNPLDLTKLRSARFFLPYRGDQILETSQHKVLDAKSGLIEVNLGAFEIKGLNEGDNQSFKAELNFDVKSVTVRFENQLHVRTINEVKQLCYTSHSSSV